MVGSYAQLASGRCFAVKAYSTGVCWHVRRMVDHRGMLDNLAALLQALPPSRAARKETRRMHQQGGLGDAVLVRVPRNI